MAQLINSLISDMHVIARSTVAQSQQQSVLSQLKTFDFTQSGNKANFTFDPQKGKYQSRAISQDSRINTSISMNDSIASMDIDQSILGPTLS